MQAVSKQNIDKEDKPKQPRQAKQSKQASRIPLKSTWQQILVRYLLDVAKMTIACAIGVALGLMFVWAW